MTTDHFANRRADAETSLDAALSLIREMAALQREALTMAIAVLDGRAEARALARRFLARVKADRAAAIEDTEPHRISRTWQDDQHERMGR